MKKRKVVMIPAKDARALVEKQGRKIKELESEIQNNFKVADYNRTRLAHYRGRVTELLATVETQSKDLDNLQNVNFLQRTLLAKYKTESAGSLVLRAINLLRERARSGLRKVVEKIEFALGTLDGDGTGGR